MDQTLEKKICDIIKRIYNAEYIGYIKVEELNPGFKLILGIPNEMIPTTIATDIDDPHIFLSFIEKELKSRNYIRQWYYKGVLVK